MIGMIHWKNFAIVLHFVIKIEVNFKALNILQKYKTILFGVCLFLKLMSV